MEKSLQLRVVTALTDRLSGPLNRIRGATGRSGAGIRELREQLKNLGRTQREIDEFRNLSRGLRQTQADMANARTSVAQLAARMRDTAQPTAALRQEFNRAVQTARTLKRQHDDQARSLQSVRDRLHTAGVSTKDLASHETTLRQRIDSTNQALSRQTEALRRAGEQQRRLAEAKSRYERLQHVTASTAIVGAAGVATGRTALSGMGRMLAPGLDFDASMSNVQALARLERSSEDMKSLRAQARQLGADTMFSATQAAEAQGFLAMAGFTAKSIRDSMPGMLDLAKAGNTELAQTADIASNILSGFALEARQMGRVSDVLVGTFTRSNTSMFMLGETMKYAAPIAAALGQDIETVSAMAGKLADAGIQGSMGGTALRSIMNRLSAPPKAAAEALGELGIKAGDAKGNLRAMPDLLQELYVKTRGLSEMKVAELFKDIAGEEAVSGLHVLVGQAGAGKLQEFIQTLRNSQGEAARTAKTQADNMRGDLDELSSAWEDVGIELFEGQNSPLRDLIRDVTDVIRSVGLWIKANPALTGTLVQIAAVIAALMVGFGGLALTVASILGPFAILRFGLSLLGIRTPGLVRSIGMLASVLVGPLLRAITLASGALWSLAANPVVLAIGAVVALIAGGAYLIWRNWETLGPLFSDLLSRIAGFFTTTWTAISVRAAALWSEIQAAFSGGLLGILALVANWSPIGMFYTAFASVLRYLGVDLPTRFVDFGKMMMQGLINGIKGMGGAVKESVVSAADGAAQWFKDKLGIRSPSRVFIGMGENVSLGAAIGIQRQQPMVVNTAKRLAQAVTMAGAMTSGSMAMAAGAAAMSIDVRPPVASPSVGRQPLVVQGDTVTIQISAAPGMDPQQLATAIGAELDRRERQKMGRIRSAMGDYGD